MQHVTPEEIPHRMSETKPLKVKSFKCQEHYYSPTANKYCADCNREIKERKDRKKEMKKHDLMQQISTLIDKHTDREMLKKEIAEIL